MIACKFDIKTCDISCKKFSMCSFKQLQEQLIQTQEQTNLLLKVVSKLAQDINTVSMEQNELSEKIYSYTAELLKIINKES